MRKLRPVVFIVIQDRGRRGWFAPFG